jgi:hypothetical protein
MHEVRFALEKLKVVQMTKTLSAIYEIHCFVKSFDIQKTALNCP